MERTTRVTDLRTGRTYLVERDPHRIATPHSRAMALAMRSADSRMSRAIDRAMIGASRLSSDLRALSALAEGYGVRYLPSGGWTRLTKRGG